MLGGGGARGAAQVGMLLGLLEGGLEPPARLIGASVGALNAATLAAYPTLGGAEMLRQIWFSRLAHDVFRVHPIGIVLSRLRGNPRAALPAANVARLIRRQIELTGIDSFERLAVPLQVVATDLGAGRPHVFERGPLAVALQASTAIPGVFPPVEIDGRGYLDGGIVDNLPLALAVDGGEKEIMAISLMAGAEQPGPLSSWGDILARTLQLSLHHRMLSDFERLRDRARIAVLCPVLPKSAWWSLDRADLSSVIEASRLAARGLLAAQGGRLFRRSAIHYLDLQGITR